MNYTILRKIIDKIRALTNRTSLRRYSYIIKFNKSAGFLSFESL